MNEQGDVLSGTSPSSSGVHHHGVFEGWFGHNRWNGRFAILAITTLGVFTPLTCFKRVGTCGRFQIVTGSSDTFSFREHFAGSV
jgi:hypothetical protein